MTNTAARILGTWVGRHPIWSIVLLLVFVGWLSRGLLTGPSKPAQQQASEILLTTQTKAIAIPEIPPPQFRVFKFKTDMPTAYVVPNNTSDDQLKSLLWLFRKKVRAGLHKEIGITQPTSKQWGVHSYQSGMLLVYKGEKCANEEYVSNSQLEKGNFGPCGYGEHDDAYYQWGIDGDSQKDDAGITTKNGEKVQVFDYKDNWHASSEVVQGVDQGVKDAWKAKQQEWEPRQRFAVQMTNGLNEKGIDVDASANEIDPKQLDFRSRLFKNDAFRDSFMSNALPQIRQNLCNVGFRSIRILQDKDSDSGQSYPLSCQ